MSTRTYALLGATGNVGGQVLDVLAQRKDLNIHCFVRSADKLRSQKSSICSQPNVKIFEGAISDRQEDRASLADCLRGTQGAFLCVATLFNDPHTSIARQQAAAVVSALETLRSKDKSAKLPVLVMLSSAEAEDPLHFSLGLPWIARKILFNGMYWIYTDLIEAEKYLRSKDWVNAVYFKPGGISWDEASGHTLSTEKQQTFISYPDVATGMIECADDGEKWAGKAVSVIAKKPAKTEISGLIHLPTGLFATFLPGVYNWLYGR